MIGFIKRLFGRIPLTQPTCFGSRDTWYPVSMAENDCRRCTYIEKCTKADGTHHLYFKENK